MLGRQRIIAWRDATINMKTDTINAIFNFSGGLLVFIAAIFPIIKAVFIKAINAPDKVIVIQIVLSCTSLVCFIASILINYFVIHSTIAWGFMFAYAACSIAGFVIGRTLPTRMEIVFEAIFPPLYFIMFTLLHFTDKIIDVLKK
jgi:hypothetical protein